MIAIAKAIPPLALLFALSVSGSQLYAKGGGPSQEKTTGFSAAPSPSGRGGGCGVPGNRASCAPPPRPGHTQPTCKGPHRGPNGVMIQCD
jgi:hypothetical protein